MPQEHIKKTHTKNKKQKTQFSSKQVFSEAPGLHTHICLICCDGIASAGIFCVCVLQAWSALPYCAVQLTSGGQELLNNQGNPQPQPSQKVQSIKTFSCLLLSRIFLHLCFLNSSCTFFFQFPPVILPILSVVIHSSFLPLSLSPYLPSSLTPHPLGERPFLSPSSRFQSEHCFSLSAVKDSPLSSIHSCGEPLQACHSVCTVATWLHNGSFQPQFPPK